MIQNIFLLLLQVNYDKSIVSSQKMEHIFFYFVEFWQNFIFYREQDNIIIKIFLFIIEKQLTSFNNLKI